MTRSTAEFVANKIGSFMDVQTNAQGNCWGISIRVKVLIDITKPIPKMLEVEFNDEPLTLYFQKKSPASGRLRSAAEAKFRLKSPNQHPNSTTIRIHSQTESPHIRPDPTKQSNLTIQIQTTSNPI
ncbi:OLC1v1004661C1 [Oldenlandia corymbosa var. corymbosa]|uniref:OLC1v1004661C1 n=1 Tax=Oldenlandia corymbosa var. corymbosa TaxID=529605 RepID=A0AAV1DEV8_OLDCO|nr:OLC1v1004661C1 [Oldenlandia corymbosa var. corymbosa]